MTFKQPVGVIRGKKRQITIAIPPDILSQIDKAAESSGISRNAFISIAITQALKKK